MFKELLSTPTAQLGKAGRFVVFQIKLWSHCARLLQKNRAGQQAAALAYHTVFGIVPLAIVMLLIFHSLPAYEDVGRNVRNLIYEHLNLTEIRFTENIDESELSEDNAQQQTNVRLNDNELTPQDPNEELLLTEYVDNIVDTFFAGLNKGSLTFISLLIMVWAALGLLSTIERAFNHIWHVSRGRGFLHRIINYWAILTLGPLLIGLGVYVSTRYTYVGDFQRTVLTFSRLGPILVSYLVAMVAFFLLYFVLPNTKVKAKAAIWGAAIAALVWTFAKWGFSQYVTEFIPYSRIYGVVGLIPLGVLWIYITWLIVLFGLQLTFTTQHLKTLDAAEIAASKKTEECFIANDLTAINVVRLIASSFQNNTGPLELEAVCSRLDIPGDLGQKILHQLVEQGILARTAEPRAGYVPAKDPAKIKLSEIAKATSAIGFAQPNKKQSPTLVEINKDMLQILSKYTLNNILSETPEEIELVLNEPNDETQIES